MGIVMSIMVRGRVRITSMSMFMSCVNFAMLILADIFQDMDMDQDKRMDMDKDMNTSTNNLNGQCPSK
jgi:hypothetical protein